MSTLSRKMVVSLLTAAIVVITFHVLAINFNERSVAYYPLSSAISNVQAQESTIGEILADQAGMAAYFQSPSGIDLQSVASSSIFRTTEKTEDEYIIGSVGVENYTDPAEDVHVFVSSDGWIVAYYPASDPASKIVDVKAMSVSSTNIGTKLETVLRTVAAAAGVAYSQPSFYDFRYPEATHLMMISGRDFTMELPSTFRYFERGGAENSCGYYGIDGENSPYYSQRVVTIDGAYSIVNSSMLLPDTPHSVTTSSRSSSCVITLLLIYREG